MGMTSPVLLAYLDRKFLLEGETRRFTLPYATWVKIRILIPS